MANVRSANTYFIDDEGTLDVVALTVTSVILTADSGAGSLTLQDNADSPINKLTIKVKSGESIIIDPHQQGMVFPNGIKVSAIDGFATLIFKENNR